MHAAVQTIKKMADRPLMARKKAPKKEPVFDFAYFFSVLAMGECYFYISLEVF